MPNCCSFEVTDSYTAVLPSGHQNLNIFFSLILALNHLQINDQTTDRETQIYFSANQWNAFEQTVNC